MSNTVDLRILKTRSKLRGALSEMMSERTFDQITVYDLCQRAKIRRATFYKHYTDKYNFLSKIISSIQNEISARLEKIESIDDPVEYYTLYVREILNYLKKKEKLSELLIKSESFPAILSIIMKGTYSTLIRDLKHDKESGLLLPAELEATAHFINGGLSSLVINWLLNEKITEETVLSETRKLLTKLLAE